MGTICKLRFATFNLYEQLVSRSLFSCMTFVFWTEANNFSLQLKEYEDKVTEADAENEKSNEKV